MTNNIELMIEEQKNKSIVVNSLMIDLQYIQTLTSQLFATNAKSLPEYKNGCVALSNLCDKTEISLRELKAMIPVEEDDKAKPHTIEGVVK